MKEEITKKLKIFTDYYKMLHTTSNPPTEDLNNFFELYKISQLSDCEREQPDRSIESSKIILAVDNLNLNKMPELDRYVRVQ